ncbi:hypothetical protein Q7P36_003839 [Cladosporium allicinum]
MESLNSQSELPPMESLHSQADLGMRTADFFDGSSSDGEEDIAEFLDREASGVEANLINRGRHSQFKRRASQPLTTPNELSATHCQSRGRSFRPEGDGYQALSPVKTPGEHTRYVERPKTPSTGMSFNGSITELLPDEQGSSPPVYPRPARLFDFSRPHSMTIEPRSEPAYRSSSVMPTAVPVVNTVDQILSAHAIAHEITLQSLMKDRNMDAFGPNGDRGPRIPAPLLFSDPRSPGIPRKFSAPEENQQTPATARKVHVLPPPIDTARSHPLIPHHFLRTPYPEEGTAIRHKDLSYTTEGVPDATTPASNAESVLTLSIRPSKPNTRRRVTSIVIPASTTHHTSTITSSKNKSPEKSTAHAQSISISSPDFDDQEFFLALQKSYAHLSGPWRFLSARSLNQIIVCGPASRAADSHYGWLLSPRSPRELAFKGLHDTFGEDKILAHYRKPAMGKSRFAFVHWAHRLAAAESRQLSMMSPLQSTERRESGADLVRKVEQPEGLEFVTAWSVWRLSIALGLVLVASVAATLLWVLLGQSTSFANLDPSTFSESNDDPIQGSGFRGAGSRVGAGLLMGISVLLVGLSSIAGWVGVSWLVI